MLGDDATRVVFVRSISIVRRDIHMTIIYPYLTKLHNNWSLRNDDLAIYLYKTLMGPYAFTRLS